MQRILILYYPGVARTLLALGFLAALIAGIAQGDPGVIRIESSTL